MDTISCTHALVSYDSIFLCYFGGGKTRELLLEEVGMHPDGFSKASEKQQSLTFELWKIF